MAARGYVLEVMVAIGKGSRDACGGNGRGGVVLGLGFVNVEDQVI